MKIEYAIWSHENGQDDLKWIQAQDYQTDISLQNFKAGQYAIHAYITIDAKSVFLQGLDVNITRPKPSLTTNISEQGVLDIAIQNIAPDTQEVLLPVRSNTNGQDDIKWYTAQRQADGTYTALVLTSGFFVSFFCSFLVSFFILYLPLLGREYVINLTSSPFGLL